MKAQVVRGFRDIKSKVKRKPGDVFDLSQERFNEIDEKLPGFIKKIEEFPNENFTVAELKAYAESHAIDLGDAKKKADILAVIEEAETE